MSNTDKTGLGSYLNTRIQWNKFSTNIFNSDTKAGSAVFFTQQSRANLHALSNDSDVCNEENFTVDLTLLRNLLEF